MRNEVSVEVGLTLCEKGIHPTPAHIPLRFMLADPPPPGGGCHRACGANQFGQHPLEFHKIGLLS